MAPTRRECHGGRESHAASATASDRSAAMVASHPAQRTDPPSARASEGLRFGPGCVSRRPVGGSSRRRRKASATRAGWSLRECRRGDKWQPGRNLRSGRLAAAVSRKTQGKARSGCILVSARPITSGFLSSRNRKQSEEGAKARGACHSCADRRWRRPSCSSTGGPPGRQACSSFPPGLVGRLAAESVLLRAWSV